MNAYQLAECRRVLHDAGRRNWTITPHPPKILDYHIISDEKGDKRADLMFGPKEAWTGSWREESGDEYAIGYYEQPAAALHAALSRTMSRPPTENPDPNRPATARTQLPPINPGRRKSRNTYPIIMLIAVTALLATCQISRMCA